MRPPAGVSGMHLGSADERSIITTKEKNSVVRRHGLTLFRPATGGADASMRVSSFSLEARYHRVNLP
jgi:hypothetical protein